jgi:ABC-type uncharacterized transport system involved in gliding motility auxiliary subunit
VAVMKRRQKSAIFGLYVAVAAAFAALIFFFIAQSLSALVQIFLALMVIGFASYILLDPQRIRIVLSGRQASYGSNALIMVLAFLGIVIAINYLAYSNDIQWDWTEDQTYTLTSTSDNIAKSLPLSVTVDAFYTSKTSSDSARQLLASFALASKGKITYRFIDPEQNPILARQSNIYQDGTIVFDMSGHQEQITTVDEEHIAAALQHLVNPGERAIYFSTGHGEGSLASSATGRSFTYVNQVLGVKNYTIQTLDLQSTDNVPKDANTVVIAGPLQPLTQTEVDKLKVYLEQGGSVVLLMEPMALTSIEFANDPLITYITNTWGIGFKNNIIIDKDVNVSMGVTSDPTQYASHAITQNLSGNYVLFFTAQTIFPPATALTGITTTILMSTTKSAWASTNPQEIAQNNFTQTDNDPVGPLPLAVALENSQTKARLVIVGDADFASDNYVQNYANLDFFINSIDWASKQDQSINLTPRQVTKRVLVNPTTESMNVIFVITVVTIPLLVLVTGIIVWVYRRRKS